MMRALPFALLAYVAPLEAATTVLLAALLTFPGR
jgi:hypothetical protein